MQYNKFLAKSDDNYQKPPLNFFGIILDFFQTKVEIFLNVSTLSSLISVEVQINVEFFFSFMKVKKRGVGTIFSCAY
jgi:hypothetical protein